MSLSVTVIICIITGGISLLAFNNRDLLRKLLMNPYQVAHHNEYQRVLTHGFIHADYMHLFFNLFVFFSFGQQIERVFLEREVYEYVFKGEVFWGNATGISRFLMLYIGALVFATIPSMVKHKDNPGYNSLGASGAVSAVLIAYILLFPTSKVAFFFLVPMPAWIAGIVFFVFEAYMNKRGGTGIAHDAHLWGAIYGLLFMTILHPSVWVRFLSELPFISGL